MALVYGSVFVGDLGVRTLGDELVLRRGHGGVHGLHAGHRGRGRDELGHGLLDGLGQEEGLRFGFSYEGTDRHGDGNRSESGLISGHGKSIGDGLVDNGGLGDGEVQDIYSRGQGVAGDRSYRRGQRGLVGGLVDGDDGLADAGLYLRVREHRQCLRLRDGGRDQDDAGDVKDLVTVLGVKLGHLIRDGIGVGPGDDDTVVLGLTGLHRHVVVAPGGRPAQRGGQETTGDEEEARYQQQHGVGQVMQGAGTGQECGGCSPEEGL